MVMSDEPQRGWWERSPVRLRVLIVAVSVVAFILVWLLIPPLLYSAVSDEPSRLKAITDTRTALLAGLVGIGALGTFWLNSRAQRFTARTLRISEQTFRLSERGNITDRYTRAADQLGSDKAPVRLAGLYALEQLAQDIPEQRRTIVSLVCAYLQMPHTPPEDRPVRPAAEDSGPEGLDTAEQGQMKQEEKRFQKRVQQHERQVQEHRVRTTAQRILQRHLSHTAPADVRWEERVLDLSGACLVGAPFIETDLTEADLSGADLTQAHLERAHLNGANLIAAKLCGAEMNGAELRGARLGGADLAQAQLIGADVTHADVRAADLTGADLVEAEVGSIHWDNDTTWSEDQLEEFQEVSTEADGGGYYVRDTYQVTTSIPGSAAGRISDPW
jgi:hypothetical protein